MESGSLGNAIRTGSFSRNGSLKDRRDGRPELLIILNFPLTVHSPSHNDQPSARRIVIG